MLKMKRRFSESEASETVDEPVENENHCINYVKMFEFIEELLKSNISEYHKATFDINKVVDTNKELGNAKEKYSELFEKNDFKEQFEIIKKAALSRNNMTLNTLLMCMRNYISSGETVKHFAGFPKAPLRATDIYIKTHKKDGSNLSELAVLRKKFSSLSDDDSSKYRELAEEERTRFATELKAFFDENNDKLLPVHKAYVEKRMSACQNTPKPRPVKQKKTKKTAFEYYCQVYERDFAEFPEEKKMKKLVRRYNKLNDEERMIYERLAGES